MPTNVSSPRSISPGVQRTVKLEIVADANNAWTSVAPHLPHSHPHPPPFTSDWGDNGLSPVYVDTTVGKTAPAAAGIYGGADAMQRSTLGRNSMNRPTKPAPPRPKRPSSDALGQIPKENSPPPDEPTANPMLAESSIASTYVNSPIGAVPLIKPQRKAPAPPDPGPSELQTSGGEITAPAASVKDRAKELEASPVSPAALAAAAAQRANNPAAAAAVQRPNASANSRTQKQIEKGGPKAVEKPSKVAAKNPPKAAAAALRPPPSVPEAAKVQRSVSSTSSSGGKAPRPLAKPPQPPAKPADLKKKLFSNDSSNAQKTQEISAAAADEEDYYDEIPDDLASNIRNGAARSAQSNGQKPAPPLPSKPPKVKTDQKSAAKNLQKSAAETGANAEDQDQPQASVTNLRAKFEKPDRSSVV